MVQLAGSGSYVPTERSVTGGAYGAIPESTEVGPQGGRELVERTLELLDSFWAEKQTAMPFNETSYGGYQKGTTFLRHE